MALTTKTPLRRAPIITKSRRTLPSIVVKKIRLGRFVITTAAIPGIYDNIGITPVFRTVKAVKFFEVTMKKVEDEVEEATESELERGEREGRGRTASPNVSDELSSDVTEKEMECKYLVPASL
jgi:hypothetical protein